MTDPMEREHLLPVKLPVCFTPKYSKTNTSTPQSCYSGAETTGKRRQHITTMEVLMHTDLACTIHSIAVKEIAE